MQRLRTRAYSAHGASRLILALGIALSLGLRAFGETTERQTHAVLINGGGSAGNNYLSHLHHLQDMVAALKNRGIAANRIHIFSGDGEDPGKDLTQRGAEQPDQWLLEGTPGATLSPTELVNSVWEGTALKPARVGELRRWFAGIGDELRPADTLLVFVTDHGTKNADDPDNGFISLWNESLSVLEFRALLSYLQPGVRVVMVMSQCYSGAFADAMTPLNSRVPGGNVCGYFSTTSDRPAYGCYPEGRDRDRIGHAFRFIDAMDRHASLNDVHAAVLINDTTPDVPVRTSDLFLEKLLRAEAARRKMEMEDLADSQLAIAWKARAEWESWIRLLDRIGQVYGTFSPRTLAELKPRIENLQALSNELDVYEERWNLTLDDLRRANLEQFSEKNPAWKERLDPAKLGTLDATTKKSTLIELLPALKEFTTGRPEMWARLQSQRNTDEDSKSAKFRTDVRLAALMRMRSLLIHIAGEQLLRGQDSRPPESSPDQAQPISLLSMRSALEAMDACEASRPGSFDPAKDKPVNLEAPEPLPPMEEDLAIVARAIPSWLGITFHPVSDRERARFEVGRGGTVVDLVYPEGPAKSAGIQTGDLILGPPDGHFTEPNQIRGWTATSPRETALPLDVVRNGEKVRVTVSLAPYPTKRPALPPPPQAGDDAPALSSLRMVRPKADKGADLKNQRHLVYFWATWCGPCKRALPELMAWSKATGTPVLAVSDEDEETQGKFLDSWKGPFPDLVASDDLRKINLSYGVSGTPTFVLVDAHGKIEWRQVGYAPRSGLAIPGWSWPGSAE